jgi:hypothetical protein
MKVREGFVSNSSALSFIINLSDLNKDQIYAIKNHRQYALAHDIRCTKSGNPVDKYDFEWTIEVTKTKIKGSVFMDNFLMSEFFIAINIPDEKVVWEDR